MKRSTAKLLIIVDMVVMIIFMFIFYKSQTAIMLVAIAAVLIFLFLSHFLRCPSCGRGQRRNWLFAQYCPYCGEALDD